MDSRPITLWIQGIPRGFEVYYLGTNNLVSVPSREYRVCFSLGFHDTPIRIIIFHPLRFKLTSCQGSDNNSDNFKNNGVQKKI